MKNNNENYLDVAEVAEILSISKAKAYVLIQQCNQELEDKGFIILHGKVPKKYFQEKVYFNID